MPETHCSVSAASSLLAAAFNRKNSTKKKKNTEWHESAPFNMVEIRWLENDEENDEHNLTDNVDVPVAKTFLFEQVGLHPPKTYCNRRNLPTTYKFCTLEFVNFRSPCS